MITVGKVLAVFLASASLRRVSRPLSLADRHPSLAPSSPTRRAPIGETAAKPPSESTSETLSACRGALGGQGHCWGELTRRGVAARPPVHHLGTLTARAHAGGWSLGRAHPATARAQGSRKTRIGGTKSTPGKLKPQTVTAHAPGERHTKSTPDNHKPPKATSHAPGERARQSTPDNHKPRKVTLRARAGTARQKRLRGRPTGWVGGRLAVGVPLRRRRRSKQRYPNGETQGPPTPPERSGGQKYSQYLLGSAPQAVCSQRSQYLSGQCSPGRRSPGRLQPALPITS
ncbi:hypothetical protein NONO_c71380 [Nocardia nova SH22a]|uniref:Uncharacterized protein n=1 Tax=Nocardia nova SH22a TaxID=1415166 RepID=W5TXG4_9NOCA|nr:hypothetical protein NONO_c71380 [Nocardia nova SH22a]